MNQAQMPTAAQILRLLATAVLFASMLGGCGTPAVDAQPEATSPADFAAWSCGRIDDELDVVQQRATDIAYAVDERAGSNTMALGVGVSVYWPALLAMRPAGLEAADLARLNDRYEALRTASLARGCAPPGPNPAAAVTASPPLAVGDRVVYEDRAVARLPALQWAMRVTALGRGEVQFELEAKPGALWRQDAAGNVLVAPEDALQWRRLLRGGLTLGQVLAGDMVVVGDPLARARLRGQVMAVGRQSIGDHSFDAAVIELFGDAQQGEAYTRVEGAIVVDRSSGVLLRLDLRSADPTFTLQRRLVRMEPASR